MLLSALTQDFFQFLLPQVTHFSHSLPLYASLSVSVCLSLSLSMPPAKPENLEQATVNMSWKVLAHLLDSHAHCSVFYNKQD